MTALRLSSTGAPKIWKHIGYYCKIPTRDQNCADGSALVRHCRRKLNLGHVIG